MKLRIYLPILLLLSLSLVACQSDRKSTTVTTTTNSTPSISENEYASMQKLATENGLSLLPLSKLTEWPAHKTTVIVGAWTGVYDGDYGRGAHYHHGEFTISFSLEGAPNEFVKITLQASEVWYPEDDMKTEEPRIVENLKDLRNAMAENTEGVVAVFEKDGNFVRPEALLFRGGDRIQLVKLWTLTGQTDVQAWDATGN